MSAPNADPRGETEIVLAGETYTLRPSFKAIAALRKATGEPLLRTVGRFIEGNFDAHEVLAVVSACVVGKKLPPDLGELIVRDGFADLSAKVLPFLVGMCTGGRPEGGDAAGNAMAPETGNIRSGA